MFADGDGSIVFRLGRTCLSGGFWKANVAETGATVIGAMSRVGTASAVDRPEMVGAYFRPAQVSLFSNCAGWQLTDQIASLEDLWGREGAALSEDLAEMDETKRIYHLERALLQRLRPRPYKTELDLPALGASINRAAGGFAVQSLAEAAGVSRQTLARAFREHIGLRPKLYCRLARFQRGLAYAGCNGHHDWAELAIELGYFDQSHMIAEFRQFSSLTPELLTAQTWFHPFIERARSWRPDAREGSVSNVRWVQGRL